MIDARVDEVLVEIPPLLCLYVYLYFTDWMTVGVAIFCILGLLILRFATNQVAKGSYKRKALRLGCDLALILSVALSYEALFVFRSDTETLNLLARFNGHIKFATKEEEQILCLQRTKHFLDLFPVVVVLPAAVTSLGLCSIYKRKGQGQA